MTLNSYPNLEERRKLLENPNLDNEYPGLYQMLAESNETMTIAKAKLNEILEDAKLIPAKGTRNV